MKLPAMGLRTKIAAALGIAALVPLLIGIAVLKTYGFEHFLATKGRLYESEAKSLTRTLENSVASQAGHFWSWIAADPAVSSYLSRTVGGPAQLDQQQVAEREMSWPDLDAGDPFLEKILENDASKSLRRFISKNPQAAEILIADDEGRVVAATRKSSDYDQSDEAWWSKGRALSEGALWTDMLHFDESAEVFSLDIVTPVFIGEEIRGVVKIVLNVSPLFLNIGTDIDDEGRFEVVLQDGRILARLGDGDYESLRENLDPEALETIHLGSNGWTLLEKDTASERMAGFAAIQATEGNRTDFKPGGYILYSSPFDAISAPLTRQIMMISVGAVVATAISLMMGFILVERKILKPLGVLSRGARALSESVRLRKEPWLSDEEAAQRREVAREDLSRIESIRTGDEVEDLAANFGLMTTRVMSYHRELEAEVNAKTALIREDLEMAREFQTALMPIGNQNFLQGPARDPIRLGFAHFYQPASTVGGDFFDLIEIDKHRTGVLIADVMGHGARSALVTAILRTLVSNHVDLASDPGSFLRQVNEDLYEVIERSGQTLFVTAFIMVVDTRESQLSWAVAGHPAPLRATRGEGTDPKLMWKGARRQPALGLMPTSEYETSSSGVKAGDVFLLYTDGVVEAESPSGQEFGVKQLMNTFGDALGEPLAGIPERIVSAVADHGKATPQDDDICVVAVEVSPGIPEGAAKIEEALTGSVPSDA